MSDTLTRQIAFLRANFSRDGAEGDTVWAVAAAAEALAARLAAAEKNVPHAFVRGYAAAVAAMERRQTDGLKEAGIDLATLEEAGVDEFDMEALRSLLRASS